LLISNLHELASNANACRLHKPRKTLAHVRNFRMAKTPMLGGSPASEAAR
jgi:hypothetical protein